jgi:hypothetical protein
MSETLSTLIAFVGFLIILSMLVQSLQEGLKNLFKLKTGVYERFFISLYKEEFFKPVKGSEKPAHQEQANPVKGSDEPTNREQVKPSSFWKILRSGQFVGEFDNRMGRLKKVVDQAAGILRDNKDVLRTIAELDPKSEDFPKKIAVSLQPVTNSLAKLTALRLDLLLDIFDKFMGGEISKLYETALGFKKKYSLPLEEMASEELKKCPERAKELLILMDKVKRMISDYRLQIEERMDAWLAQLNEVYRRNMLKWTVAIGAVIVFIFNADAFTIYRYLATHDVARAVISQQVQKAVVPAQKVKAEDLNMINDLIQQNKAKQARDQILTFSTNMAHDLETYKKEDKAKLARNIKKEAEAIGVDPPTQQALESLGAKTGELAMLYVNLQKISFDRQLDTLTSLSLPLGWQEDWNHLQQLCKATESKASEGKAPKANASEWWVFSLRKIGGLVLTIFLITFGAPFWNDILSALTGFKNKAVKEGKPGEP